MKIALHICCGICATTAVERLTAEGHQIFGLFYNPNIQPLQEYHKRFDAAHKLARDLNFHLDVSPYNPEEWLKEVAGLEGEPEGGKRCPVCFRLRLEKTYLYMKERGLDSFTTTLTISPHKSSSVINRIGLETGGDKFLVRDFKKKDGFKRATELSHEHSLYRQDYCGCLFSIPKSNR